MRFSRDRRFLAILLAQALASGWGAIGNASEGDESDSIVIKSNVFVGVAKSPTETHVTILAPDKIYDIRTQPDRMTIVFDRELRRFQIGQSLPPMQTSLTADDLIRFSADLQAKATESPDALIRFAATPKFLETFDADAKRLELTSDVWDYRVDTRTVNATETLTRYREFADWFTYLNAIFRPLPPGARLELNRVLHQHEVIPERVEVTVRSRGEDIKQHSTHTLASSIGPREQELIKRWERESSTLPIVDFARFHSVTTAVTARTENTAQ